MADRELRTALKITGDAASAVKATLDLKQAQADLGKQLDTARQAAQDSQAALDAQAKRTDSLAIQTAIAKKALQDLVAQGLSKTQAEYQALAGEIANNEAELKRELAALKQAESAHTATTRSVAGLEKQFQAADTALARQEERLKAAGVDVGNLAGEYARLQKAQAEAAQSAKLDSAFGDLGLKSGGQIAAEIAKLQGAYDTLKASGTLSAREIEAAQVALRDRIAEVRGQSEKTTGVLQTLGKIAGTLFAVDKIREAGTALVETEVQYGKLRASLNTVTNSTKEAAAAWDLIQRFQADAPIYTIEQITQAWVKLKALGLDPSERALRSYGNTSAAMGKTVQDFVEAVADAVTGEFERLKEFGIKASAQGDQVGFTFQGVTTQVQNNAKSIQEYLLGIGETKFADGIKNQSEEAAGALGRLSTGWEKFKAALSEGLDVKGILGGLADWFNTVALRGVALQSVSGKTRDELLKMYQAAEQLQNANLAAGNPETAEVYRRKLGEIYAELEKLAKIEGPKQAEQDTQAAAQAVDEFADKLGKSLANADQFKAGIDALAASTQTLQAQYDGLIAVAEAERKAAEASGDTATALAKAGEVRQLQVEKAQSHADSLRAEAAALEEYAAKVKTAVDADGQRSAAEQAAVAEAEQAAAARRAAAAAAEAEAQALAQLPDSLSQVNQEQALGVDQLEKYRAAAQAAIGDVQSLAAAVADGKASEAALSEARATAAGYLETYRQALATYTQQQQAASEAASREAALLGQGYDTRIAQVQALQAAAKARGDEAAAAQAGIQILQLEAAKSAALAEAKQKEYEAMLSVIDAKLKEAEADGTLTQAEQQTLKAAQDVATAKRLEAEQSKAAAAQKSAEADGARKAAEAAKQQAGANKEQTDAQGKANQATEDSISLGISGQKVLEQYNYIIQQGSDAWSTYRASIKLAQDAQEQLIRANTMEEQFQQAAQTGQGLVTLLDSVGVKTADLGEIVRATTAQFNLLDQQQLQGLQSAIASAAQKLDQLRTSAQSTLRTLQSSLDSVQGNQAARWRASYQQQQEDIQKKIQEARAAGDAKSVQLLQQALQTAGQVYRAEIDKAAQEYQDSVQKASDSAAKEFDTASHSLSKSVQEAVQAAAEAAAKAAEDLRKTLADIRREALEFATGIDNSIRELERAGMTEAQARADIQSQIHEMLAEAGRAIQRRDLEYAKTLRNEIEQLAKSLATATGGVTEAAARSQAIAGLKQVKGLNEDLAKAQEAQAQEDYRKELDRIEAEKEAKIAAHRQEFEYRASQIEADKRKQLEAAKLVHDTVMGYIRKEGQARGEVLQTSTRRVTTTITAATGGLIAGEGRLVTTPLVSDGTSKSDWSPRNTTTKHFSAGGPVSGSGTGDTVPAMLTPGEVVLRKAAVQDLGVGLALDLNARGRAALRSAQVQVPTLPRQFLASGGLVGAAVSTGPGEEITVRLVTDRAEVAGRFPATDSTRQLLRELKRSRWLIGG